MIRIIALLSIAIAMDAAVMAQEAAKPDTVQVHGKSLALSCAEWKRNPDGSWTSTGPLLVGTDKVNSVILHGAKDTNILEAKCGSGASPAAKPQQSPAKPARRKHQGA